MELLQLKTFSVVAKTLHFRRAAEELKISQAAVSNQIKSLEQELGEPLFYRNPRRIELSFQGKRVLNYADLILEEIEIMKSEVTAESEKLSGRVKLAGVSYGLNTPFHELWLAFRNRFPEIELSFEIAHSAEHLLDKLRRGEVDAVLIARDYDLPGVTVIPFGSFELFFVVGQKHPLAKKKTVKLTDLMNFEWLCFDKGSWLREITDSTMAQNNFLPSSIFESNDGVLIRKLLDTGSTVSLLPAWAVFDDLKAGRLAKLRVKGVSPRVPISVGISEKRRTRALSLVINYILEMQFEGINYSKAKK